MREVRAAAVYIAADRLRTIEEINRARTLAEHITCDEVHYSNSREISWIMQHENRTVRTGEKRDSRPTFILSAFDWTHPLNDPDRPRVYVDNLPGIFTFADYRDRQQLLENKGVACNSAWEIHSAFGCMHSCSYCHIGNYFTIMVDVEKTIEKLGGLIENNPQQKLYKWDNQSDIMTLEPEYCATKKMVEFFAKTDKTLMLYTKSDNVDHLLDLDHKGNTVVCWTISSDEVARKHEQGAPSLDARLDAARKCKEAGYRIRYRFSPLIPIEGWEEGNNEMIRKAMRPENRPEVISIETLCHMKAEQASRMFRKLAIAPQAEVTEYELFSHEDRARIYRLLLSELKREAPDVVKALCLETPKMWADLSDLLDGTVDDFYCCCGEDCA
ncbi:MAG: hypothetical protein V1729_05505 [Candidatus Woesearchaeota archaeon]